MKRLSPFFRLLLSGLVWLAPAGLAAVDPGFRFPSYGPIVEADPAVREEREVLVPSGFQTARTADELVVCEDAGPLVPVKLMVGHKMVLGTTRKLYIYQEGTARPGTPMMEGLSSGTPGGVSKIPRSYPAEPFGFVQRGKPYVVEIEVVIFETDIPAQHMWSPQSKKYQVLWRTTLRQTPKEERELPADIRERQAELERIKPQPTPMPEIPEEFLRTTSEPWKRILATEITAGFKQAPLGSVVGYLGVQAHVEIVLKAASKDPAKPLSIFRGFDHKPLRAVLYEITEDTRLTAEWELDAQGTPVRILITDRRTTAR